MGAFSPSREEISALGRGDGDWENIQEVLRGAFHRLFVAVAANGARIVELEQELAAKARESARHKQHVEAVARTLNVVSEELRREKEEMQERHCATERQGDALRGRVDTLELLLARLCEAGSIDSVAASVAKAEHRLGLLEDELGHVIEAVEHKADMEEVESRLVAQKRALVEALRKRCKTVEMERGLVVLRRQIEAQLRDSSQDLMASVARTRQELAASEVAALADMAASVDSKLERVRLEVEGGVDSRVATLDDRLSAVHSEATAATAAAATIAEAAAATAREAHECAAVTSSAVNGAIEQLRQRVDEQSAMEQQTRSQLLAECAGIRSELLASVARLETSHSDLQRGLGAAVKTVSECAGNDQLQALETRLSESHRDATVELHLQLSDATDRAEAARSETERCRRENRERFKALDHQLQDVDHVARLIGKQLVRTVSQLQVLWDERRAQLEATADALADDPLPLEVDALAASHHQQLQQQQQQQQHREATGGQLDKAHTDGECGDEGLAKLRSDHEALRSQVSEKLHHYQALLRLGQ